MSLGTVINAVSTIQSPAILIVQFSIFPFPSSQCIVYPLILDCTVNDMLDIKLGDLELKSVKNGRLLGNGAGVVTRSAVAL